MEELQLIGRRFISQGFHVHVGVQNGDNAIKAANVIQGYLPILLALSASSPYSQGEDTGLMSYRTKLFEALPLAGLYPHFENWRGFAVEMEMLIEVGIIGGLNDMWWDTRPNPHFGTLEVRICDLPIRFSDILGITAVIQALVATLSEEMITTEPLNRTILKANKWQAVRHGLAGKFLDPAGLISSERIPMIEAVERLLDFISKKADSLGSLDYISYIQRILKEGTGADFLRKRYLESGDFHPVIKSLQKEFWL